jgi:xylulose-5-phosphate/fructose-6-phosphate phosphoketolase
MEQSLIDHRRFITRFGEDMPEVRDWRWPAAGLDRSRNEGSA